MASDRRSSKTAARRGLCLALATVALLAGAAQAWRLPGFNAGAGSKGTYVRPWVGLGSVDMHAASLALAWRHRRRRIVGGGKG